jgi:hypothetical protein
MIVTAPSRLTDGTHFSLRLRSPLLRYWRGRLCLRSRLQRYVRGRLYLQSRLQRYLRGRLWHY